MDYRRRGVRFRKHFSQKNTAQEFRRKMEDITERERAGLECVEPIVFGEFCKLFMDNHFREKSAAYKRKSDGQINNYFLPVSP